MQEVKLIKGSKPKVIINIETHLMLQGLARINPKHEMCAYVETSYNEEANTYTLFGSPECPDQEVEPAHFDVSAEGKAAMMVRLDEVDKDSADYDAWGHSHVRMGVNPSAEDEAEFKKHIEVCSGTPYLIRFIWNQQGSYHFDIADNVKGVVFSDLDYVIDYQSFQSDYLTEQNKYLTIKKPVTNNYNGYNGYNYGRKTTTTTANKNMYSIKHAITNMACIPAIRRLIDTIEYTVGTAPSQHNASLWVTWMMGLSYLYGYFNITPKEIIYHAGLLAFIDKRNLDPALTLARKQGKSGNLDLSALCDAAYMVVRDSKLVATASVNGRNLTEANRNQSLIDVFTFVGSKSAECMIEEEEGKKKLPTLIK